MEEKPEIRDKAGHPDNLTQNIINLNTNKAEDTEDLEISKAHYIKLGTGGK